MALVRCVQEIHFILHFDFLFFEFYVADDEAEAMQLDLVHLIGIFYVLINGRIFAVTYGLFNTIFLNLQQIKTS